MLNVQLSNANPCRILYLKSLDAGGCSLLSLHHAKNPTSDLFKDKPKISP